MTPAAERPWEAPLREERALPSAVRGPLESFELAWLALTCAGDAMSRGILS